jgi:hypothetical protein
MRVLVFKVDGQTIHPNSLSELHGLVAGTSGYIKAKFLFSDDWNDCVKVAGFESVYGEEFEPQKLDEDNSCYIPEKALEYHEFEMKVLGKGMGGYTITTRPIRIKQFGGKQ